MEFLFEAPVSYIATVLLLSIASFAWVRGYKSFARGLKNPDHPSQTLWVVRGIRGFIIGLALMSLAGGIYFDKTWPLLFGLVFLGEELLETGIMVLALRKNEKDNARNE